MAFQMIKSALEGTHQHQHQHHQQHSHSHPHPHQSLIRNNLGLNLNHNRNLSNQHSNGVVLLKCAYPSLLYLSLVFLYSFYCICMQPYTHVQLKRCIFYIYNLELLSIYIYIDKLYMIYIHMYIYILYIFWLSLYLRSAFKLHIYYDYIGCFLFWNILNV